MMLRRFSQSLALALATVTFWAFVLRPDVVVDSDTASLTQTILAVLIAAILGGVYLALRFGTGGSAIYWRGASGSDQVRPVALLIAATVGIHFIVGAIQILLGILDTTSATVTSLLVWTLVPAAFLQLGLVKWPTRQQTPSKLKLTLVAVPAAALMLAISYGNFIKAGGQIASPSLYQLIEIVGTYLVAAAAEEVVFRVLLLTALLDLTASRLQAVFLSSVVFAAVHAPLFLEQPIIQGDWQLLALAAAEYAPLFLLQVLLGLILGIIWLRSGSITLVTVLHAIVNIAPALADNF